MNGSARRAAPIVAVSFLLLLSCATAATAEPATATDTWEALRSRPYPQWFQDAKLGVFIHWGVYSVPAYGGPESYAEWFLRGLQVGAPDRLAFMHEHYGEDFTYADFAPLWRAELFDPDAWAELFVRAGADYVVLVAKHHDGFCLWPSAHAPGWNSVDVGPGRDIVGELAAAVRRRGLRFGLYYSLPEWNHPLHRWYTDPHDQIHDYVAQHMVPQFKELVGTYRPDLLFADGEWFNTAEDWRARELIAWYFDLVGDPAVVNDRWGHGSDIGFRTPEYSAGQLAPGRPWAEVRGLGRSFGLNRNEQLAAYLTAPELVHLFVRTVAHGGGLIINVGPAADGTIPLLQQERLEQLGHWLRTNEEAIRGSRPWQRPGEQQEVSLERIDPQIDFDWVRNAPGLPIAEDHFTATWTGYIAAEHTGEHTFSAVVDDGMRLLIAGRLVLDLRDPAAADTDAGAGREDDPRPLPGRIVLERGVKVSIRIEYHETVQNARIHLYWESPAFARQIVPQANLFSTATVPTGDGLQAVYRSQRQHVAYTHNHGNLYAVAFAWPEDEFVLPVAAPAPGTRISLLGRPGALPWRHVDGRLIIDTSPVRYSEMPGHHAWTFRIENHE